MNHTHSSKKKCKSEPLVTQSEQRRNNSAENNLPCNSADTKALAIAVALILATLLSLDPVHAQTLVGQSQDTQTKSNDKNTLQFSDTPTSSL